MIDTAPYIVIPRQFGPGVIQRTSDGAFIPADPANADYQVYQFWVASGSPATPPADPSP